MKKKLKYLRSEEAEELKQFKDSNEENIDLLCTVLSIEN